MLTDRAHDGIDAFGTGLDHAVLALGYLSGVLVIVATVVSVIGCSAMLLRDPARRLTWRIDARRNS